MKRTAAVWMLLMAALGFQTANAEQTPAKGLTDSRVRVVAYDPDQVIRLKGYVGYQIYFQFSDGESFVNLAAGDNKALDVGYQANHLVLKPLAEKVTTNITVITTKHVYHFDYSASAAHPDPERGDVIYALRFIYPEEEARQAKAALEAQRTQEQLAKAESAERAVANSNYWGCGDSAIRPVRAVDDGVQTRMKFSSHAEFPTIYIKNDDSSESLVNFTVERDELIIHRVARQFVLRRGRLVACVQNRGFDGGGERLPSETVVPGVVRETKGVGP